VTTTYVNATLTGSAPGRRKAVARVRQLWLSIKLATGMINQCIHEAGRSVAALGIMRQSINADKTHLRPRSEEGSRAFAPLAAIIDTYHQWHDWQPVILDSRSGRTVPLFPLLRWWG